MPVFAAFRYAAADLLRHRMRTVLTTLGIGIGIAAVICTVAIGQGSADTIRQQQLKMGEDFVWIGRASRNIGGVRTGAGGAPSLTPDDLRAIPASVPLVRECTPQVNGRTQLIVGHDNWNTNYLGVTRAFFPIRAWQFRFGGPFGQDDVDRVANVAVLGSSVSRMLFGDADPVGADVRVGREIFKVVGVTLPKGQSVTGWDQDDIIFMPYTTAQKKLRGVTWVDDIMCSVGHAADLPVAGQEISALLMRRHRIPPGEPPDFQIRDPQAWLQVREQTAKTMGLMLSAVASVSLLVGGVGIMNIMLVSVAERTREIGVQMAIGARGADIRRQFIAEAVLLGLVGGAFGIGLGIVSSSVLTRTLGWPMTVSVGTMLIAACAASAAGFIFGYLPASHAAALDPIEALRTE